MLPLLAASAVGGLLQGGLGFFANKKKANEAKRMERNNQAANELDTAWQGMLGPQAKRQEQFDRPSALGGALQGAASGAMQGANVYQGLMDADAKRKKMLALAGDPTSLSNIG